MLVSVYSVWQTNLYLRPSKQVFHELARHLQTRRLLAGDTLSLDSDSSFYIVIDGTVQVFAPLAQNTDCSGNASVFDDDESPGLQLLNEVKSGGTLSSLFTILSLFAEDIHLGTTPSEDSLPQAQSQTASYDGIRRRASAMPPGSEQLQLNVAALRYVPNASTFSTVGSVGEAAFERFDGPPAAIKCTDFRDARDSEGTDDGTVLGAGIDGDNGQSLRDASQVTSYDRGASLTPPPPLLSAEDNPPAFFQQDAVPPMRARMMHQRTQSNSRRPTDHMARNDSISSSPRHGPYRTELMGRPHTPGSILSGYSMQINRAASFHGVRLAGGSLTGVTEVGQGSRGLLHEGIGTIGRATADTTLAVIPAEAFKRLTKKYPHSAAHIIQVILTRLSRVTFHTAHQYLGLTREIMRTERRINEIASFPLPSSFYEQGGIERLRQRFLPEPKRTFQRPDDDATNEDDYFINNAKNQEPSINRRPDSQNSVEFGDDNFDAVPTVTSRTRSSTPPWCHLDPPLRTPRARTTVGPGDLLSMTGNDDLTLQNSPPTIGERGKTMANPQTTPSSKRKAARPGATQSSNSRRFSLAQLTAYDLHHDAQSSASSEVHLKDEILESISKAIGLQALQPPSPHIGYEASPFLSPNDASLQRSMFNSGFSSLSMLDGMMFDDENSSITGTSSFAGVHHTELENEVEVKFFPAGSTLVKAGETRVGLFYVVDGFLDIFVSANENLASKPSDFKSQSMSGSGSQPSTYKRRADPSRGTCKATSRSVSEKQIGISIAPGHERVSQQHARPLNFSKGSENDDRVKDAELSKLGNSLDGTRDRIPPPSMSVHTKARSPNEQLARERSHGAVKSDGIHDDIPSPGPLPRKPIYSVGRGGLTGYLSSLLGSASFVDIKAKTDVYVGYMPAKALERIMENRPSSLLTLSKRLLTLLSPLILHIDSALDWQQVNAGHVIYREGDPSDSFYIVINGRLRAISDKDGAVDVLGEYGQGDSVGELDVITSSPRQKTLHAIRDTELVRMPMTLFNAVAVRHPQIAIQISRIIARRVRQQVEKKQDAALSTRTQIPGLPDLGRNNANLKTVAILPVTKDVPVVDFANRLQTAFEDTIGGPTAFLNQSSVMSILGRHAFNRIGKLKLAGWLAEQEQKYRLVLYVVDTVVSSPWAQTSIRQADSVLLVGFGDDPAVGEYERLLLSIKTTARKELVLLHPERSVPPGSTREWLKSRPWIHAHHHVEMPGITRSHATPMSSDPTAVQALKSLKEKLETSLQRYRIKGNSTVIHDRPHHFSDFARLARRLCGKSIGLVLGGGGARGCAHFGVIQALEERGIPIDMIGGTSIGSLIGGLYAKEGEAVSSYGRAKKFSSRMASLWRFASDLTYPVVSYTTGHEFNRGIFKAISDTHIEDMWLPFFCNTTNITWSRMEVHTTGYAWRYIRGSMTLAGLIPPLIDEGDMLVDGGYVDNLPVSVMLAMGANSVFAVDVGSIDDTSPRSYGDTLSGWWVLLNKWNPWSEARNIPSIPDIQGRLTYVSSVKTLEEAKRIPGCYYMRMPVEGFGTLEFGAFNEISRIGYAAASKMLDEWAAESKLPTEIVSGVSSAGGSRKRRGGISARRNSV